MKKALKRGAALERLVAAIERAAQSTKNVSVESPKRIRDRTVGQSREFDVVLTFKLEHHTMRMALECRDRSRKVTVPDVEAFAAKFRAVGIDRGMIVSSLGFHRTAIKKAELCNVGCLALANVDRFDWCLAPGVRLSQRELVESRFIFDVDNAGPPPHRIFTEEGILLGDENFRNLAVASLEQFDGREAEMDGQVYERVGHDNNPHFVVESATGSRTNIKRITVGVRYRVSLRLIPLSFHEYLDVAANRLIGATATARLDAGTFKGQLVLNNSRELGMRLTFVPDTAIDAADDGDA